mmetsp:Transcript_28919/g.94548  ORF Transcript_28919/g.94548 Transcript_28919/m.94548 type:complete len:83 (-) Transcript_28919:796-1044(-)
MVWSTGSATAAASASAVAVESAVGFARPRLLTPAAVGSVVGDSGPAAAAANAITGGEEDATGGGPWVEENDSRGVVPEMMLG